MSQFEAQLKQGLFAGQQQPQRNIRCATLGRKQVLKMRKPSKVESLARIKQMGLPIGTILDVGVQTSTPDLIQAFPDKKHILMEPLVEWNAGIAASYRNIDHEVLNVAVSDKVGTITLETYSVYEGLKISHANICDNPTPDKQTREVQTLTLDAITSARDLPRPYFLKIDVDGAELRILAGAKETLKYTGFVNIEAQHWNLTARAKFLEDAGFELLDIVDLCYYDGIIAQVDLMFISSKLMRESKIRSNDRPFDGSKWKRYNPS
jgi:FkbM family methyltransferase